MSYNKQNFKDGQILTASMLAKMEDGIIQNEADIQKVSQRISDNTAGTQITETAAGAAIAIADSAEAGFKGLRVFGKTTQDKTTGAQLAYLPDFEEKEVAGVTWSCKNGAVTAKGTPTVTDSASSGANLCYDMPIIAGTYYISGEIEGDIRVYACVTKADGDKKYYRECTFTLDGTETLCQIYCQVTGATVDGTVYPMVNTGDSALPWEPYTGGKAAPNPEYPRDMVNVETPEISVYKKNLAMSATDLTTTIAGVTITAEKDKSEVILSGTSEKLISYGILRTRVLSPGKYTISVDGLNMLDDAHDRVYVMNLDTNRTVCNNVQPGKPKTFEILEPVKVRVDVVFAKGSTYDNKTVRVQIEAGEIATDYEPYKEPQTIAITTPSGLPGIPVTTGGNYTDANGQQWITDEVDFERGVYVQRIHKMMFDGSQNLWMNNYQQSLGYYVFGMYADGLPTNLPDVVDGTTVLSDKLSYREWGLLDGDEGNKIFNTGNSIFIYLADQTIQTPEDLKNYLTENPIAIQYAMATPIETPLTDEEIAAYKAANTNYPATTITNDAGAGMEAKYVADTKLYQAKVIAEANKNLEPEHLYMTDQNTGTRYELTIVDGVLTPAAVE